MSHIPPGQPAISAYLVVNDAMAAVDWYCKHLGADITFPPMVMEDGRVGHVEVTISGAPLLLSDEFPEMQVVSPRRRSESSVALVVWVPDADATVEAMIGDGGQLERRVKEQAHGARAGWVVDPFGHRWNVSTHHTEVSVQDILRHFDPDDIES